MLKAIDVAKLFLHWTNENGDLITNLRMQKLLYYAQAWYLVNYKRRLFSDIIIAEDYGPIISTVYRYWIGHGVNAIPYCSDGKEKGLFRQYQLDFLIEFFNMFSKFSATALAFMICSEDPWKDVRGLQQRTEITPSSMREFYTELYEKELVEKARSNPGCK